jgi:hypothetical protein
MILKKYQASVENLDRLEQAQPEHEAIAQRRNPRRARIEQVSVENNVGLAVHFNRE